MVLEWIWTTPPKEVDLASTFQTVQLALDRSGYRMHKPERDLRYGDAKQAFDSRRCCRIQMAHSREVSTPRALKKQKHIQIKLFTSSYPPPDGDCSRRATNVGVAKKLLIESELPGEEQKEEA